MPQPLPSAIVGLPETIRKFREHAKSGEYTLALKYHQKGRVAIDNFVADLDGDRARQDKWRGVAAELDAEARLVKVNLHWLCKCQG